MDRAQLPLSVVEAALGVLLLLSITAGFALGVAPADAGTPQLDAYASDAATLLANEQPRHAGQTRLSEVSRSADAFQRERDALERRAERILPDNVMYRIETHHGAAGYQQPTNVPTGTVTVATGNGEVTIRVWYA